MEEACPSLLRATPRICVHPAPLFRRVLALWSSVWPVVLSPPLPSSVFVSAFHPSILRATLVSSPLFRPPPAIFPQLTTLSSSGWPVVSLLSPSLFCLPSRGCSVGYSPVVPQGDPSYPRILSPLFRCPFCPKLAPLPSISSGSPPSLYPRPSLLRLPSRGCSRRLLEGLGSLTCVLLDSTFPHFDCRAHHSRLAAGSSFTGENASSNLSYSPAFWSFSFLVQGTISTNTTCHGLVARKRCPAGVTHKGREPLLPTGFVSRFYGAPSWRIHRIMSLVSMHKLRELMQRW